LVVSQRTLNKTGAVKVNLRLEAKQIIKKPAPERKKEEVEKDSGTFGKRVEIIRLLGKDNFVRDRRKTDSGDDPLQIALTPKRSKQPGAQKALLSP